MRNPILRTPFHLFDFLAPRYCFGCKKIMNNLEDVICADCLCQLGQCYNTLENEGYLKKKLSIYYPIENSASFIFYQKNTISSILLHRFKYDNDVIIGKYLTGLFSLEISKLDWIKDIDLIIPLPLHWKKTWIRGYNQSEIIGREISNTFSIELETRAIRRIKYNKSQVRKSRQDRWKNVENIFKLTKEEKLRNKHILIVDDIITTGASINSCVKAVSKVEGIRISVIALGLSL